MSGVFLDAQQSSHPVSQVTDDPLVILANFDSISYDKGASIIRMMAGFIGQDTFDRALVAYINKFQYSNAAKVCSTTSICQSYSNHFVFEKIP